MVLVLEIALLIAGIAALVTGKLNISRTLRLRGAATRVAGVVLILPLPVAFAAGFAVGLLRAVQGKGINDSFRLVIGLAELGIILACVVGVAVITAVWGQRPPRKRFAEEEDFEEDDVPARPRRAVRRPVGPRPVGEAAEGVQARRPPPGAPFPRGGRAAAAPWPAEAGRRPAAAEQRRAVDRGRTRRRGAGRGRRRGGCPLVVPLLEDASFGGKVSFFLEGQDKPFAELPGVEGVTSEQISYGTNRDRLTPDQRVRFFPAVGRVVTIPGSNDRLVLHRFGVDETLAQSGVDYLVITSLPPAAVRKGEAYTYQVTARSSKGGVKFRLDSGPPGMQVSDGGKVTRRVPADWDEAGGDVVLAVTDGAGQEAFHTFRVRIFP